MPRPAAIVAAALAALALAGPAAAAAPGRIVPGRAIGPVAVGDERATIGLLPGAGTGVVIQRTPDPANPGNRNFDRVVVAYPVLSLTARFPTDEASSGATSVSTRSPRYRTAAGIGVGSTRSALRARHPATTCTGSVCTLVRPAGTTRFLIAGGRVIRVAVGG